jgi:2-C-methyl-D-erythritol 4-phosphate cytidylyltransferase
MAVHALLAAAGRGERMRGAGPEGPPKQLLTVAGRPLLAWAVARLRAAGVERFVIAAPADLVVEVSALFASELGVDVVSGGSSRQESVERALTASTAAAGDWVLVHDAARAAVHPHDVRATLAAAAQESHGAILGRPVNDTLKRLVDGHVEVTVPRDGLFRAETPQVFRRAMLEGAYARANADGFAGTDECSLVERLAGARVAAVAALHPNPKVTYTADLRWLELLLGAVAPEDGR